MPKAKLPSSNSRSGRNAQSLEERMASSREVLTESELRLAEVIVALRYDLSGYNASELAKHAGVSNATAARFFQHLGYASYGDVRRQSRNRAMPGSPLETITTPERVVTGDFRGHFARDIQNLSRTAEALSPEQCRAAGDILRRAGTVWVVGFRNSMALAVYARALLITVRPDVRLLPQAGMTLAEDLASLGARDAVLAIGFRRRPAALADLLALAREVGAASIVITDSMVLRRAPATVTLRCHTEGAAGFDSYAAAMALLNYVCTVEAGRGAAAVERLHRIEALHASLGSFQPVMKGGS